MNDSEISFAIARKVREVATIKANEAYNQNWYGQYGGEDVTKEDMDPIEQFSRITDNICVNSDILTEELVKQKLLSYGTDKRFYIDKLNDLKQKSDNIQKVKLYKDEIMDYLQSYSRMLNKYDSFIHIIDRNNFIDSFENMVEAGEIKFAISELKNLDFTMNSIDERKRFVDQLQSKLDSLNETKHYFWQIKKKKENSIEKSILVSSISHEKEQLNRIEQDREIFSKYFDTEMPNMLENLKSLEDQLNNLENKEVHLERIISSDIFEISDEDYFCIIVKLSVKLLIILTK